MLAVGEAVTKVTQVASQVGTEGTSDLLIALGAVVGLIAIFFLVRWSMKKVVKDFLK